ncbi:hypothetical protein FH972_024179 [Carpinus fangiana]|uniref:Uncharacterized protein n=1 Tax=Carpinus fangiana TaxID=176857 RepID=A0A5N6KXS3_9ROSI|nr:hypothetical protein FH972_024179 [Carpinus fangiana]
MTTSLEAWLNQFEAMAFRDIIWTALSPSQLVGCDGSCQSSQAFVFSEHHPNTVQPPAPVGRCTS